MHENMSSKKDSKPQTARAKTNLLEIIDNYKANRPTFR